ncbi:MAG: gliding motility-associated C-terminal domain-containing protein [Saprospiraceae bacterium]|nr:gliding motility-associated C-terminal domain-containing protein [Saprospiraceae bacterium]
MKTNIQNINHLIYSFQNDRHFFKSVRIAFCILSCIFYVSKLQSQDISLSSYSGLNVCDTSEFFILLENNEGISLSGNSIRISLPCGFRYVQGSVVFGTESDISNLSEPVLNYKNLTIGEKLIVSFRAILSCESLQCIDRGDNFSLKIVSTTNIGTKSFTSSNLNIETPFLVITGLTPVFQELPLNNVVERKVIIRNSRLGFVRSFIFSDFYTDGLIINSPSGTVLQNSNGIFSIRLGPEDFKKIGNLDEKFDFNEEIEISELITASDCSFKNKILLSDLTASWGCEGQSCQSSSVNAGIRILSPEISGPALSFSPVSSNPDCYSGGHVTQKFDIKLIPSTGNLSNLEIVIDQNQPGRGILVGSVNTPWPFSVVYEIKSLNACGDSIAERVIISIPFIANSDTEKEEMISWEVAHCESPMCGVPRNQWTYTYRYNKDCAEPKDRTHGGGGKAVTSDIQPIISGSIHLSPTSTISDGLKTNLIYDLSSEKLINSEGIAELCFTLPLYMRIDNQNFELDGKIPVNIFTEVIGNNNRLCLSYELPFSKDSVSLTIKITGDCAAGGNGICKDTIITACSLCEEELPLKTFSSVGSLYLTNTFCTDPILVCADGIFISECYDGLCPDTLAGYLDYTLEARRLTLGLPDKNGDGMEDTDQVYNLSLITYSQILPGDTFLVEIKGAVNVDFGKKNHKYLTLQLIAENFESTNPNNAAAITALLIGPDGGLRDLNNTLKIYDSDENVWHTVKDVPFFVSEITHTYDMSVPTLRLVNPDFPENYEYKTGDSIIFQIERDLNINYMRITGGNTRLNQIFNFDYYSRFILNDEPLNIINQKKACNCKSVKLTVSGVMQLYTDNGSTINQGVLCPDENYSDRIFSITGHGFTTPGELKAFYRLKEILVPVTSASTVLSLTVITGTESKTFQPFKVDSDYYYFKTENELQYAGFFKSGDIFINRRLDQCLSDVKNNSSSASLIFDLTPQGKRFFRDTLHVNIRNNFVLPELVAAFDLKNIISLSNKVEVDFSIKDVSNFNFPIKNKYVKILVKEGDLKDIMLFDSLSGTFITSENNVFRLPDIVLNKRSKLTLNAISLSCNPVKIYFEYGYLCENSNSNRFNCYSKTDSVLVSFPKGISEISPTTQPAIADLCSPMEDTQILFFNAGLGSIYNTTIDILLPVGLNIVPGSVRLIVPQGSNNEITISDPVFLSARKYRWRISEIPEIQNVSGIPGVNSFPDNGFELVFKTIADCDFISGTQILYTIQATEICGIITNKVNKTSQPYQIRNVEVPTPFELNAIIENNLNCQNKRRIDLSWTNPTGFAGILHLSLPDRFSIDSNSISGNLNNIQFSRSNDYYVWNTETGETISRLSFDITLPADQPCGNELIQLFISSESEGFCVETNSTCNIGAVAAAKTLTLDIIKSEYEIPQLDIIASASPDSVTVRVVVRNLSIPSDQQLIGTIYNDVNNNGIFDSQDSFLNIIKLGIFQNAGESITTEIKLSLKNGTFCSVILLIDAVENCLCVTPFKNASFNLKITNPPVSICWDEEIVIGKSPVAGYSYQWNNTVGLSCDSCSSAVFNIPNTTGQPVTYIKELIENDPFGCQVSYLYNITTLPKTGILTGAQLICSGDTAILISGLSANYEWTGNNIISTQGQVAFVRPDFTSDYFLKITDFNGCISYDTVTVTVNNLTSIPKDYEFCKGIFPQLNLDIPDSITFKWTTGVEFLSDPFSKNPVINSLENITLGLMLDNGLCSSNVEINIRFFETFDIPALSDLFTSCIGDSLLVQLPEIYQYEWTPTDEVNCQNTECNNVIFTVTEGVKTITLFAIDSNGCSITKSITIQHTEGTFIEQVNVNFCEGDSLFLYGKYVLNEGNYCDTLRNAEKCLVLNCTEITLLPKNQMNSEIAICQGESVQIFDNLVSAAGTYCNTYKNIFGCDSTVCIRLDVNPMPSLNKTDSIINAFSGSTVQLFVPENFVEYEWSPSIDLSCMNCPDPITTISIPMEYIVKVTDLNGCTAEKKFIILIPDNCLLDGNFQLPNGFSPNGDQVNDIYTIPVGESCGPIRLTVFNRWGNIVFFREVYDNTWDGRSDNGGELPQGTYFVLAEWLSENFKKTTFVDLRRN